MVLHFSDLDQRLCGRWKRRLLPPRDWRITHYRRVCFTTCQIHPITSLLRFLTSTTYYLNILEERAWQHASVTCLHESPRDPFYERTWWCSSREFIIFFVFGVETAQEPSAPLSGPAEDMSTCPLLSAVGGQYLSCNEWKPLIGLQFCWRQVSLYIDEGKS